MRISDINVYGKGSPPTKIILTWKLFITQINIVNNHSKVLLSVTRDDVCDSDDTLESVLSQCRLAIHEAPDRNTGGNSEMMTAGPVETTEPFPIINKYRNTLTIECTYTVNSANEKKVSKNATTL